MNKNIFKDMEELGEARARIKQSQDVLLDMYDPKDKKLNNLLKELCELDQQYEILYKDYEEITKQGDY